MDIKCLDTYALVEIHNENPKFRHLINQEFVVPNSIMAEFYGVLLRDYNEKTEEYIFKELKTFLITEDINILTKAVKFRKEHKKKNLSFFDCVGYIFAKENKMKFVTGDKEFENLPYVEFIK